jgi:undecaprenyl-diphosphatase
MEVVVSTKRAETVPAAPLLTQIVRLVTSAPVLAAILAIGTIMTAGPLQPVDQALNRPWKNWIIPSTGPILAEAVDPLASQKVAAPLLGLVALWLVRRRRTIRPLALAAAAELSVVFLAGAMKLIFARPSPTLQDADFFAGGLLDNGWDGISYPSGHAVEAVALYGTIALLVARYTSASRKLTWFLVGLTIFISSITVVQSFYMRWHWMTDLAAGLLVGLLILRVLSTLDATVWDRWARWQSRWVSPSAHREQRRERDMTGRMLEVTVAPVPNGDFSAYDRAVVKDDEPGSSAHV